MDLFNNPAVLKTKQSLSKEEVERYEKQGEYMFNSIDLENEGVDRELKKFIEYIETGIQSGLTLDDLDDKEVEAIKNVNGKEWYKKYNFPTDEIDRYLQKK